MRIVDDMRVRPRSIYCESRRRVGRVMLERLLGATQRRAKPARFKRFSGPPGSILLAAFTIRARLDSLFVTDTSIRILTSTSIY